MEEILKIIKQDTNNSWSLDYDFDSNTGFLMSEVKNEVDLKNRFQYLLGVIQEKKELEIEDYLSILDIASATPAGAGAAAVPGGAISKIASGKITSEEGLINLISKVLGNVVDKNVKAEILKSYARRALVDRTPLADDEAIGGTHVSVVNPAAPPPAAAPALAGTVDNDALDTATTPVDDDAFSDSLSDDYVLDVPGGPIAKEATLINLSEASANSGGDDVPATTSAAGTAAPIMDNILEITKHIIDHNYKFFSFDFFDPNTGFPIYEVQNQNQLEERFKYLLGVIQDAPGKTELKTEDYLSILNIASATPATPATPAVPGGAISKMLNGELSEETQLIKKVLNNVLPDGDKNVKEQILRLYIDRRVSAIRDAVPGDLLVDAATLATLPVVSDPSDTDDAAPAADDAATPGAGTAATATPTAAGATPGAATTPATGATPADDAATPGATPAAGTAATDDWSIFRHLEKLVLLLLLLLLLMLLLLIKRLRNFIFMTDG